MFKGLAKWAARKPFVREAILQGKDLSAFRKPPSARLIAGVALITISMLMGWPSVGLLGVLAAYLRDPIIFLVGGPATYAVSWLVWFAGMALAGPDNIRYGKEALAWASRVWVEKTLGPDLDEFLNHNGTKGQSG